jgi:septal ring factor EnvC (AmiA/AmiB activator)
MMNVSTEKDIKESQRKITEVESGIQGVGNLFDNLKTFVRKTETQLQRLRTSTIASHSGIKTVLL